MHKTTCELVFFRVCALVSSSVFRHMNTVLFDLFLGNVIKYQTAKQWNSDVYVTQLQIHTAIDRNRFFFSFVGSFIVTTV